MKLRNLFLGAIASLAAFTACEEPEQNLGTPDISLSVTEMTFDVAGGEKELAVKATRDWMVETDADWVVVSPESGSASSEAHKVTVTTLENTGLDREASLKFTIGMKSKYLTVTQAGPGGSAEALVVYGNNFDKTKAEKGDKWATYLDTFDGWRNETGTGIASVSYASKSLTARTNSGNGSAGSYSDYVELGASGMNYLWFGTAPTYFAIKNITLPEGKTDFTLSFGTERYLYQAEDNTYNWDEFSVYVSADAKKWVKLAFDFAGGVLPNGRWDLASSTFTVPVGTSSLNVYFTSSLGSAYAIDDLKLVQSESAGTIIDFASGEEFEVSGDISGGSNTDPGTGDLPEGTGEGTFASPYDAAKATNVASAMADGETKAGVYVKGIIKSIKEISASYGNASYYLTDADGVAEFYVFRGKYLNEEKFTSEDQIKVGDEVVVFGDLINYMGNTPELSQGNYIVTLNGVGAGEFEAPESQGEKTVADFITAADVDNYYTLSGVVSNYNSSYCSFDLTDDSGAIYVYSVLAQSKSQWASQMANGGTVTIYGKYAYYDGGGDETKAKHEVVDAYIVSYTPGEGGDDTTGGDAGEYDPDGVTWTLGTNAFDNTSSGTNAQSATVNGVAVSNLLKLGTSSKVGDATLHLPAGTTKLGFYCVAWKDKTAQVKFSVDGTELTTITPAANTGATGNAPYTALNVADTDYFEIDMPSINATNIKVETLDTANGRVLFVGLKAIVE